MFAGHNFCYFAHGRRSKVSRHHLMGVRFLIVLAFCLFQLLLQGQTESQRLSSFAAATDASISYSKSTGRPNFIRMPRERGLRMTGGSVASKCQSFLSAHGDLFGINHPAKELVLEDEVLDRNGSHHITYQQVYHGVPVFDGKLKFHFDQSQSLTSVNGVFVPDIKVAPVATLTPNQAREFALQHIAMEATTSEKWLQKPAKLYIYRKGLARGTSGSNYLAYEVELNDGREIRTFMYMDAHSGEVIDQVSGIYGALFRRLYEVNTSNEIWTEGGAFPGSLDMWQQNEMEAAGHTYHFFKHAFGFDSYDGAGAEMRTVHNDPSINCPNANWNGSTANYCTGSASDDVVGHEWGHAYTEYTSGLIYAWQAGALNESYSDIWGETIDLLNNYEDGDENLAARTGCGSSSRWRMGEDASAFGGAIRDMWDPTCQGDPGKVSDSEYWCSIFDNGGVHTNSGVNNHAYALLVDGGSYNGYTILGLGFTKAAHIFWRAQRLYLTATSDFEVQADALEASCADLMGINLEGLSTTSSPAGPSGEVIVASDLVELQKVVAAVELRMAPPCSFQPLLAPSPLLCLGATKDSAYYYEDFEAGLGGWITEEIPTHPSSWEDRSWLIADTLPDNRPGSAVFGIDPINGDCIDDSQNGILRLESPAIIISAKLSTGINLAFEHYVSTEYRWDGGNVKYKLNGSDWQLLPTAAFTTNSYNTTLNTSSTGSDNPLAGQEAFTGSDDGSVGGSWGRSVVNLSSLALMAEDTLRLRWEMGTDGCNGRIGWYVDDVRIYSCQPCVASLDLASTRSSQAILFESSDNILVGDTITGASHIQYSAGSDVELVPGFSVASGAQFEALIEGCEE